MPVYAQLPPFMQFVRTANPTFERYKASSLRPLLGVLTNPMGTAGQVCQAIAALPIAKTNRYIDALYYLLATYPGLPANAAENLQLVGLGPTEAVYYQQTPVPPNYNPAGPQPLRIFVTPPSVPLGRTVEQFVLDNRATTGVLLIHLSGIEPGMHRTFNGRTTLVHIASVLRVARLSGCPICVLTMDATSNVCAPLRGEYSAARVRVRVYEPNQHMGSVDASFRDFMVQHQQVVVAGFDACVCVFANVFGANELMPDNTFRLPVASLTNVVMSRAILVTNGTITSMSATLGQAEYGPLFNI